MSDRTELETRSAEISFDWFSELYDMDPMSQLEWVRENVDEEAVGVDSVEAEFPEDDATESRISYFVESVNSQTDIVDLEHTIHQQETDPFSVNFGSVKSWTGVILLYSDPTPQPPVGHDPRKPWCECGATFDDRDEAMDHLRETSPSDIRRER